MRARLRYSVYSPRAPRRYAGYVAGLLLATLAITAVLLAGVVGPMVTHAAALALVTA